MLVLDILKDLFASEPKIDPDLLENLDPDQQSDGEYYDPDERPPNFKMAINHGKAKMIQKFPKGYQAKKICPCCGLPIDGGQKFSLGSSLKRTYHLGPGYALYFQFFKYCIFFLILVFVCSGLHNLLTSAVGNDCADEFTKGGVNYCNQGLAMTYSLANQRNNADSLTLQNILNVLTLLGSIWYFQYVHFHMRKKIMEADRMTITPSDYTIQIKGLPTDPDKYLYKDSEIIEFIEQHSAEDVQIRVKKVVRAYAISEYIEYLKQKESLENLLTITDTLKIYKAERSRWKKKLRAIIEKIEEARKTGFKYTDTAYVSLAKPDQTYMICQQYKQKKYTHIIRKIREHLDRQKGEVLIRRACEPTDVMWENLSYTPLEKLKKRLLTAATIFFLVFLAFIAEVLISYWQIYIIKNYGEESIWVMVGENLTTLVIVLVDPILGVVIGELVHDEKHSTRTGYFTQVARRMGLSQFINTALTLLFAKIVVSNHYMDVLDTPSSIASLNFYGKGGLIENMYPVLIVNAFVNPFLVIFDPVYIFKLYNRRKALKDGPNSKLTQEQAHELFQGPPFDIDWRYGYLIMTMFLTMFYAPILPMGIVYTIIGLTLTYWADKYVFLYRIVLPPSLSSSMQENIMNYMQWMLFFFAAGNLIFGITLQNDELKTAYETTPKILYWAGIVITTLNLILPMRAINEYLYPLDESPTETLSYDEAKHLFMSNYDIENPVTRREALDEYIGNVTGRRPSEYARRQSVRRQPSSDEEEEEKGVDNAPVLVSQLSRSSLEKRGAQDPFGEIDFYAKVADPRKSLPNRTSLQFGKIKNQYQSVFVKGFRNFIAKIKSKLPINNERKSSAIGELISSIIRKVSMHKKEIIEVGQEEKRDNDELRIPKFSQEMKNLNDEKNDN